MSAPKIHFLADGRFVAYPAKHQYALEMFMMTNHGPQDTLRVTRPGGHFGDVEVEIRMLRPRKFIEVTLGTNQCRVVRLLQTGFEVDLRSKSSLSAPFKWTHQDIDTDQWVPFDNHDQYLIEQAFLRREKQYVLQGGGDVNGGVLDFARMKYSVGNFPEENLRRSELQTTRFEPERNLAVESRTYEYRVPTGWAPFPTNVS
eukprot:PhF_6_TR27898/c0_g4_i1/m.40900